MSEQDLRQRQPDTAVANSSGSGATPAVDAVSVEESGKASTPSASPSRGGDKRAPRPTSRSATGQQPAADVASAPAAAMTDVSGAGTRSRATHTEVAASHGAAAPPGRETPPSRPAESPPARLAGATPAGASSAGVRAEFGWGEFGGSRFPAGRHDKE